MGSDYKVLDITEMSRVADLGGVERYYRHRIKSAGGVVLTVDIDSADFTPERSRPILQAAAANADKILEG